MMETKAKILCANAARASEPVCTRRRARDRETAEGVFVERVRSVQLPARSAVNGGMRPRRFTAMSPTSQPTRRKNHDVRMSLVEMSACPSALLAARSASIQVASILWTVAVTRRKRRVQMMFMKVAMDWIHCTPSNRRVIAASVSELTRSKIRARVFDCSPSIPYIS
jgi:hypothetical protein